MNTGKCAGGPLNDRVVSFEVGTFVIPMQAGGGRFIPGIYRWHEVVKMWIWDSVDPQFWTR